MDPRSYIADYRLFLAQMAQPPNQHVDPRNSQQSGYQPSPQQLQHQQQQQQQQQQPPGHGQYNAPNRMGPMRLDLPPQPVFMAPAVSPNAEYPNQYGPPPGFSYQSGQPMVSPNLMPPPGHAGSSSQLYPPPHMHDGQQQTGRMYPGSLPTSPYGPPAQPTWEQQQQQQGTDFTSYQQPQLSPYYTPYNQPPPLMSANSTGSNGSNQMQEYFPVYDQVPEGHQQNLGQQPLISPPLISPPLISPPWQSPHLVTPVTASRPEPQPVSGAGSSVSGGSASQATHPGGHGHGPKTSRQQFTACGACRHRRVKCDLKARQDEMEKKAAEDHEAGTGPVRTNTAARKQKVKCTNCQERGMNCVDEFAPIKAAKQLRRGKRISEIEVIYGKQATNAAAISTDNRKQVLKARTSPSGPLPELTPQFFESPFFRRFQVQRPILDPQDFVARYLSFAEPRAANLGPEGAILCHVLYTWAVSYGVDEYGQLDVPEGGDTSGAPISLLDPGKDEVKRENDRQARFKTMKTAVEVVLDEIDACGILRKPTWDGVRVLLLLLPLTEGIRPSVERLAMYESALSQVFMLCSYGALGYDGKAAGTSSVNGGSDSGDGRDINIVRIRTYWYAFVHEGITTGLKGGRLLLDGDDLETIQDSISNRTLVSSSSTFRSVSRMAVAPINLALACRVIHKALTGPTAKRRNSVNPDHVKEAWEALEACWEEFESIRNISPSQYSSQDEIIRFVDGWKIFLFEAQNVIRSNLEDRLTKLTNAQATAYISDPSNLSDQKDNMDSQILTVSRLLAIARSKCDVKTRQIMAIVRQHVGTRFFEWDASLVRDGTYYTAMLLAKHHGSDEDIAVCVQALNELRWAHAKAWDRSADLRREWATRSAHSSISTEQYMTGWEPPAPLSSMVINTGVASTTPVSHPNSSGTHSSLSNSSYNSSPSLISPIYETSNLSISGPAEGYWQHNNPQASGNSGDMLVPLPLQPPPQPQSHLSNQYGLGNLDSNANATMSTDPYGATYPQMMNPGNQIGYQDGQDLIYNPNPDQQGQGGQGQTNPAGRYVFQADGSQLYVPYSYEQ